jgi:hypothetical protein
MVARYLVRAGKRKRLIERHAWRRVAMLRKLCGQLQANWLSELRTLLGEPMVPDFLPLYAVVAVLFSLIYFSLASLSFLLVRLDIPEVWQLFRGLFNVYFWMVGASSLLATAVFAVSGRLAFTAAMLLLAATAMAVRKRVLQLIDTQQAAWQSGDTAAMRRLRMIHWGGMLANIVILSTLASSARFIL